MPTEQRGRQRLDHPVPHKKLMRVLRKRVSDRRLLGLIARFLKVDVLDQTGKQKQTQIGTPQGSVMSPILVNIYLHAVLDKWFMLTHSSKQSVMVRYADDAVFIFSSEKQANDFLVDLRERFAQYDLKLNEDKTRIINFKEGQEQVFSFLGFTFYWTHQKKNWRRSNLMMKTQVDKLFKKVQEYTEWIKANRSRMKTKVIWKITAAKLRGHYNYFGYFCNRSKLSHFYYEVIRSMFKWLNRRSQRKSFSWAQFKQKLHYNPLLLPPEPMQLKRLGWSPYVR